MGRPRKRRLVDESDDQQASAPAELVPHQLAGHASSSSSSSPSPSQLQFTTLATPGNSLDMDYSAYYDTGDYGSMASLDMPFYDFSSANGLPQAYLGPEYADFSMGYAEPAFPASGLQFGGVDLLGGINFDEQDPANTQLSEDINNTAQDILALNAQFEERKARETVPQEEEEQQTSLPSESTPGLSPPQPAKNDTSSAASSSAGPSQPATPAASKNVNLKPLPDASCTCLSRVYLALDSLTRLPEDIIEAMKVARGAARAAHDVIVCPTCAQPAALDVTIPPTMQMFQNTMLLGTLLPTTANAYVKILEMIETTANEAKEKDEDLVFRLSEYGGYWGNMAFLDKIACHTADNYGNKVMKPEHWRLTVRALLKLDVYGYQVDRPSVINGAHISHRHLGLRDVIQAMEERSTRRHDLIDAMVASGQPHPLKSGQFSLMHCDKTKNDKDERHCLKIVELARNALDKLVIA
jgi:hypothetical protein